MMEERIPLGRFGRPEDIAEPVCFMASDMAKYSERSSSDAQQSRFELMSIITFTVTGASLLVDGGAAVSLQ